MSDFATKFVDSAQQLKAAEAVPTTENIQQAVTRRVHEQLDELADNGKLVGLGLLKRIDTFVWEPGTKPSIQRTDLGKKHPELEPYSFPIEVGPERLDPGDQEGKLIRSDIPTAKQAATEALEAAGCRILAWSHDPDWGGDFAHVEHPEITAFLKSDGFES